jgi:hypothetical protein
MPVVLSGRFGWSDRVGPLWFLRERWTVGPSWRSCWARFFASPRGVTLQAHTKKGGFPYAGTFIPWLLWCDLSYVQKEDLVMGWLRQVRRPEGPLGSGGLAVDAEWVQEFPALHEYVTYGVNPDGSVRRTSTLTLFAEGGSWKVFLNERDSGASLCASGETVSGALSALEVMLEGESPPWRFSDRGGPQNGRKSRKGS